MMRQVETARSALLITAGRWMDGEAGGNSKVRTPDPRPGVAHLRGAVAQETVVIGRHH